MSSQEIAIADAVIATVWGWARAQRQKIVKLLWEEQLAKNRPSALRALALHLSRDKTAKSPALKWFYRTPSMLTYRDGESDAHSEADGDSNDSQSTAATIHDTGLLEGECVENVLAATVATSSIEAEKAWFRLRVAAHRYRESSKHAAARPRGWRMSPPRTKKSREGEDDDGTKRTRGRRMRFPSFLLPALLPAFEDEAS
ncbi:hypothetical protein B0H13DRAFT_2369972 [Mycena leptocephala]|nr:hypothetical protein B0H13DRAFT_2369972 [Mycena leptocephala]